MLHVFYRGLINMQADAKGKDKNLLTVEDAVHMQKSRTGSWAHVVYGILTYNIPPPHKILQY